MEARYKRGREPAKSLIRRELWLIRKDTHDDTFYADHSDPENF
jgi:hypothetical protein